MTMRLRGRGTLSILAFLLVATVVHAAPGDLDPTFGTGGKVRVAVGGGNDHGNAVVRQADGKLLVAGTGELIGTYGFALVRYNTNGSLDSSFGVGGKVVTRVGSNGAGNAVALLSDGKILVAGFSSDQGSSSDFAVAKYNSNGTLDTSFGGGDGIVTTDIGNMDNAHAVAVQSDGKIVVAGETRASYPAPIVLLRYNADGSPDSTFDNDGKATVIIPGHDLADARAIGLQGSKIVVAGFAGNADQDIVLVRFLGSGALDSSFDGDGIVVETDASRFSEAYSLAFLSTTAGEDKIVAAGFSRSSQGGVDRATVWSYNSLDGSPDTTFGTGGRVITNFFESHGYSIKILLNAGVASRILVGGDYDSSFAVIRLLLDGNADTAFDGDGIATARTFPIRVDSGRAMLIQPDNRVVVAGTSSLLENSNFADFAIARFNANGSLDTAFDGDGKRLDDVGDGRMPVRNVSIQPDGKIVAAGGLIIARFNADGSFDPSFDGDGKLYCPFSAINAMGLQADGKIVVAGFPEFTVSRFNADGSTDASFGAGGTVTIRHASSNPGLSPRALAIQPDGQIIVAGLFSYAGGEDFAITRVFPSGTPDPSFGVVVSEFDLGNNRGNAVTLQSDGKIVLAGSRLFNNQSQFGVARFNATNGPDSSFDFDGKVVTAIGVDSFANAVLIQAGKVVVAGSSSGGSFYGFALARYLDNGAIDSSFEGGGKTTTPVGTANAFGNAMASQSDGKFLVGGHTGIGAGSGDFALVRYDANGAVDPSYGTNGRVILDMSGGEDTGSALVVDASDRAIIAGDAAGMFGLARLVGSGPTPTPTASPTPSPTATPTPTPTPDPSATPTPTPGPSATPTPTPDPSATPTPTPSPLPTTLANISTRLLVETGDNILIGGFIVTGTQPKKVIVRGIGTSLPFLDKLENPTLELHGPNGLIEANDNWVDSPNAQAILDSTIPPSSDLEAAIVATLPANNSAYTAVVRGANNSTGIGVVEAYDLDNSVDSKLANISTRGFVQTGDNVLIAGTIVSGQNPQKVLVRAIGPSLGFAGTLDDPTLELRDQNGGAVAVNDNWRSSQETEIIATTIPPTNDFESALIATLPANGASYTAIVRGVNDTTGIAVVEVYALP